MQRDLISSIRCYILEPAGWVACTAVSPVNAFGDGQGRSCYPTEDRSYSARSNQSAGFPCILPRLSWASAQIAERLVRNAGIGQRWLVPSK